MSLPSYTPSVTTPKYSARPYSDEQTLGLAGRVPQVLSTSQFVKQEGKIKLTLDRQDQAQPLPVYSRDSALAGSVSFAKTENLLNVELQLQGRIKLFIEQGGSEFKPIISITHPLWQKSPSDQLCPSSLSFSYTLPHTCQEDDSGKSYPLPPTFNAALEQQHDASKFGVDISYSLSIVVLKRYKKFFKITRTLTTAFVYRPRTRPGHPLPTLSPHPTLLNALKATPSEWSSHEATIKTTSRDTTEVLRSDLLLPRTQIFCMSQPIPFHIQLTTVNSISGSVSSIPVIQNSIPSGGASRFLQASSTSTATARSRPSTATSVTSTRSRFSLVSLVLPSRMSWNTETTTLASALAATASAPGNSVLVSRFSPRIYLLRRVCVGIHGQRAWRARICGEAQGIRPIHQDEGQSGWLCWDGHIVPDADRLGHIGPFSAPGVQIEDYIVVSLTPFKSDPVSLRGQHHAVEVRVVTDPYPQGFGEQQYNEMLASNVDERESPGE